MSGGTDHAGAPRATRPISLLFVNKYYAPDVAATGQILGDLAEHLAARGHSVRVLASRERYAACGRAASPAREFRNGVEVVRLGGTAFGRARHAGRVADYAAYYARVLARLLAGRRYDGVVFLTTPPLLGVVGWLARALRGQRYAVRRNAALGRGGRAPAACAELARLPARRLRRRPRPAHAPAHRCEGSATRACAHGARLGHG
jgi:hypothetical protein